LAKKAALKVLTLDKDWYGIVNVAIAISWTLVSYF